MSVEKIEAAAALHKALMAAVDCLDGGDVPASLAREAVEALVKAARCGRDKAEVEEYLQCARCHGPSVLTTKGHAPLCAGCRSDLAFKPPPRAEKLVAEIRRLSKYETVHRNNLLAALEEAGY